MNHRRAWSRNATWLAGTVTLLESWSCSLLYDFNTSQCNETQDCKNQGPQFEHSKCLNHVCVQTNSSTTGGTVSTGGSSTSGNTSDTGGSSAENSGTLGGTSSSGGSGGTSSSGGSLAAGGDTSVGGVTSGGKNSTTDTTLAGGSPAGGDTGIGGAGGAGGMSAGGVGGTGGTPSTGGTVGTGGTTGPACTTNNDCISTNADQPYICKSGTCVLLTSSNCPVLIPKQSSNSSYNYLNLLKNASPIIVGGFANMGNASEPHTTQAVLNWDLAFVEFNSRTLGGLPSYKAGGPPRPYVGLICQGLPGVSGYPKDITASMTHLTQDIGVSSVLSTLAPGDLLAAFNTTSENQNVFFINTGSANLTVVNTTNGGMLWHMLGDPHMLAATIVSLVHQMEPYIYKRRKAAFDADLSDPKVAEDPDSVPLRVTMVYSDHATMVDMHDVLTSPDTKHPEVELKFNGKSFAENKTDDNFHDVEIQSITSVTSGSQPNVAAAITELRNNPPHLILAMATSEFPTYVMQSIETYWGTTTVPASVGVIRPYYIMSHLMYNTQALTDRTKANVTLEPPLHQRVVGVNYAEAQDHHSKTLYGNYLSTLQAVNSGTTLSLSGTENYYDGAYYLLYSIAAAARQYEVPTSGAIRDGFTGRVIYTKQGSADVDIGPLSIAATVSNLLSNSPSNWALWGTMGYPNFDPLLGTRISQTSAWCIQHASDGTETYQPDGLIYDAPTQTYSPNSSGIPACLQYYCPPDADAGVSTCPKSY